MTDRYRIDYGVIKQASRPALSFTWPLPTSPTHAPADLTGATITGTMQDKTTAAVTVITGAFTVEDGATRLIEWQMSDDDTGTAGSYNVTLKATMTGELIYTVNGSLTIESNPAVSAVAGPALVGVPSDDATVLDQITTAVATADDGYPLETDGSAGVQLGPYRFSVNTVADAGAAQTLSLDAASNVLTLTEDCEITMPTPTTDYCILELVLIEDITGGWEISFVDDVEWPDGTAPTQTTTGGNKSIWSFSTVDGGTTWFGTRIADGVA